jgi:putative dehydrogenase
MPTLHHILEQIEDQAEASGTALPLFAVAKQLYDRALADGWGELDIAAVHDVLSGQSPGPAEPGSAS